MSSLNSTLTKISGVAASCIAVALVAQIGYLVVAQYRSQVALQKTQFSQLTIDTEKRATAVSYFFSERENDLQNLVEGKELSHYFENKALGMSLEYGLHASLLAIRDMFERVIKSKKIGGHAIYERIVFLDAEGKLLVQKHFGGGDDEQLTGHTFPTDTHARTIFVQDIPGKGVHMFISTPYFFKEQYKGQVLAVIPLKNVYNHFIEGIPNSSRYPSALVQGRNYLIFPEKVRSLIPHNQAEIPAGMKAGAPYTFIAEGKKGAQKVTAILVPIENTPLSVVTFFPPNEQYGGGSPLKLLYTTGVVALFIFAGMIFFVRLNTSKAILLTRLDETILRERTVDEKNLQLSHEIAERKLAEAELREEHAFRKAIESSTLAGITATDLEGRQIYVNPAFCNMIGWSAEKLIDASPPFVYWPEEERDKLTHALRMAIEGTPLPEGGIDSVFLHHDGSRINVRILLSPLKGETEPCSGCLTSVYDVTERTRMEEHIRASLTEKEVLLKEIHHRVKNNMQVISSLLSLQSKYILDQEMRDLFRESQERVKSMALIHEKLYRSGNLAQIDFGEYVQTLSSSLVRTYAIRAEKVNVKVAVSKIFFGVDTAIPCGLIINELVSNALKHAFPGGRRGTILISLHVDDQGCNTLVVSDDGIGFPEGLDFRHTASLGMKLVNMLTGQLSGTIELICSRGTEFRIVFPADPVR